MNYYDICLGKSPGPSPVPGMFTPDAPPSDSPTGAASATSLSPLQRMASITNSLVSQPHMAQHQNHHAQRPLRAVLPPITQQQFDKFQHLNTDDTVRRVSSIDGFSIKLAVYCIVYLI